MPAPIQRVQPTLAADNKESAMSETNLTAIRFLEGLPMTARLRSGFGFLMLLVVAMAVSGAVAMLSISRHMNQIVEVNNARKDMASDLVDVINDLAITTRNITLLTDLAEIKREMASFEQSVALHDQIQHRFSDALAQDDAANRSRVLMGDIMLASARTLPNIRRAVKAGLEGYNVEATSILTTEVQADEAVWLAKVREMLQLQRDATAAAVAAARSSLTTALLLGGVLLLLALSSGGLVAQWMVRNNGQMMSVIAEQNANLERRVNERTAQLELKTRDINAAIARYQHLASVHAMLAATNEALLYAQTPHELFQRVCDAAVSGHDFITAAVMRQAPDALWLTIEAASGRSAQGLRASRFSVDAQVPEGQGMAGIAYRDQQPSVCNDYQADERTLLWRSLGQSAGVGSAAVFPIRGLDASLGVMLFYASEKNAFTGDIVLALERVARNIAFALSNFERDAQRVLVEDALRESEARFRALTLLSSDWYWEQDADYRFTRMDSRHLAGDPGPNRLIGRRLWDSRMEIQAPGHWDEFRDLLRQRLPYRDVIMMRVVPGLPPYYVSISGEPRLDAQGQFLGYRGVSREITEQMVAEESIRHMARHDALTGLPNRMMFSNLLNLTIPSALRYERCFAVMFIDLDRFKFINDTLGHEAGDTLLKEITGRFQELLRTSDVIARLGGDEFVVLVQEVNDREQAAVVAQKVLEAAHRPMILMGQECRVSASIGIAMFPEDGHDEVTLMKNADGAMYVAKAEGKNNFQFFSPEIHAQTLERLGLESALRRGMERNEFSLNYQAKLDLKTGAINGVEALLRWHSAELGPVSPAKFIPIAEETGLIVHIGRWVLKTACAQNMAWQKQGLPPITIAVNLSVRQFADEALLDDIRDILETTGMPPHLLELEITEGMLIHNIEHAIQLLTEIKAMGVRLAIDDFGTGYSSLGQLKNFPIDTLKVDRSFIRDLATDSDDKAITSAIIAMGKTLSLTVVAEGVETIEQQAFLREQACDEMQGYYFSRPIAADEFETLLRGNSQQARGGAESPADSGHATTAVGSVPIV